MAQKFIIVGDAKESKGYLRMGVVYQHRDLVAGYEKVWGGGFWDIDPAARRVVLSGYSGDFGRPLFQYLSRIDRDLRGYTFVYREDWSSDDIPLDTSAIEWV